MSTRCQPGDLAIIIRDDPGYEENTGRIVTVHGPGRQDEQLGTTWLIVPASDQPYSVMAFSGCKRSYRVLLSHRIEHPDEWMFPIRPDSIVFENELVRSNDCAQEFHA